MVFTALCLLSAFSVLSHQHGSNRGEQCVFSWQSVMTWDENFGAPIDRLDKKWTTGAPEYQ